MMVFAANWMRFELIRGEIDCKSSVSADQLFQSWTCWKILHEILDDCEETIRLKIKAKCQTGLEENEIVCKLCGVTTAWKMQSFMRSEHQQEL